MNLGCRSETCCTRLAENAGHKNRQKVAICAPSHNFLGLTYTFATKALIDNRKQEGQHPLTGQRAANFRLSFL